MKTGLLPANLPGISAEFLPGPQPIRKNWPYCAV
jgi:hypothetical protein